MVRNNEVKHHNLILQACMHTWRNSNTCHPKIYQQHYHLRWMKHHWTGEIGIGSWVIIQTKNLGNAYSQWNSQWVSRGIWLYHGTMPLIRIKSAIDARATTNSGGVSNWRVCIRRIMEQFDPNHFPKFTQTDWELYPKVLQASSK